MGLEDAPKASWHNRSDLSRSEVGGCYYCRSIFSPEEILDWTDDGETALCPRCGIDSVVASATGYEITPDLLKRFRKKFFDKSVRIRLPQGDGS